MSAGASASAPRACLTCRKQKRRCTKELPECSLCRKNGRACNYGADGPAAAAHSQLHQTSLLDARSPHRPLTTGPGFLPQPGPGSTSASDPFPPIFFLDFDFFQEMRLSLREPTLSPPHHMVELANGQSFAHDADIYFNSVHTFLPIVSKLRLYRELSGATESLSVDTRLLIMAMRLYNQLSDPEEALSRETYGLVKAYCNYIEQSNVLSMRLMQAYLLVALYEVSNAIYPAAYLTVGHCARLGHAMGIHDRSRAPQMLTPSVTATEFEERRRAWWAVIVLDRFVNIGGRHRPFACDDARPSDLLPIDDKHWEKGELHLAQPLAVSASTTIPVCPFARTCQGYHLLSRVLRHLSDIDTDFEFRFQEAVQLHHTLAAFHSTVLDESKELLEKTSDLTAHLTLLTAIASCQSALQSLYDRYSCTEKWEPSQICSPTFLEMQKLAIAGLREVSDAAHLFSKEISSAAQLGGLLKTSPLVCNCLYQAAATYLWFAHETGDQQWTTKVSDIKNVLELLGTRWKLPKEYIKALESYDFSVAQHA